MCTKIACKLISIIKLIVFDGKVIICVCSIKSRSFKNAYSSFFAKSVAHVIYKAIIAIRSLLTEYLTYLVCCFGLLCRRICFTTWATECEDYGNRLQ